MPLSDTTLRVKKISTTKQMLSSRLAVAFGLFLLIGETVRNWGEWEEWYSYFFDYLFATLLVAFGVMSLKGSRWALISLFVVWSLTVAVFTYSVISHVLAINERTNGPIPQIPLTLIIGALDIIALVGLLSLASTLFLADKNNGNARAR